MEKLDLLSNTDALTDQCQERAGIKASNGRLWIKTNEIFMIDFQECTSATFTESPPVVTCQGQYLFPFIQEIFIECLIWAKYVSGLGNQQLKVTVIAFVGLKFQWK